MIDHAIDDQSAAQMKSFDFRTVIDNSTVERLVREGFFEKLFGPGIKAKKTASSLTTNRNSSPKTACLRARLGNEDT